MSFRYHQLPTEEFIEIWTKAIKEKVNFNDFMTMLMREFHYMTDEISPERVRSKCQSLNSRFSKGHGIRIPVPPRNGRDYWSNMVKKFNLCEFREEECF